jgi:hypothetical protein
MFRKITAALAVTAAVAAAALTPTTASAWGWHGHHGWHGHYGPGFRVGFYGPGYVAGPSCYIVKRPVELPDGSLRVRRVTVCE